MESTVISQIFWYGITAIAPRYWGAEPGRRYGLLDQTSLLSPE